MKIALICTDNESLALGMRSVSSALRSQGYESRLVFMKSGERVFSQHILDKLACLISDYEVVGISCLAQGSYKAKQVLHFLRPLRKTTIWGGVHASLNPEDCVKHADYVCVGEGDETIIEFMDRLSVSNECKKIRNIAYQENGALVINELRPLIANLDDLPLPDFSFSQEFHLVKNNIEQVSTLYNAERNGQIAFTGSRGCVYFCTYCCNIKLKKLYPDTKKYVRRISVTRLIEHSRQLRKIFPAGKYFYFIDEDFAARPHKELQELAERFPKEVGLPFECLAHPARITEQKLDLLAKAGLFRIRIGIETGSERTKKEVYNRHVSNEVVSRAAAIISRAPHIAPVYFFIYANPYENREDILATLHLIKSLPYGSSIQAFELMFFPGSILFDRAIEDGLITGERDSGYELNYYGGLHHEKYPWKQRNLYENGLLFLAGGYCTRYRVGTIPRFAFDLLIHPRLVRLDEKLVPSIRILIFLKSLLYRARYSTAQFLKLFVKNPYAIYNFRFFIRNKLNLKSPTSRDPSLR